MKSSECVSGLRVVFVRTLKKLGAYTSFRKHYTKRCVYVNSKANGFTVPVFYFYFERYNNKFYEKYLYDKLSTTFYTQLISNSINFLDWDDTEEGWDYWNKVFDEVITACCAYLNSVFVKITEYE